jgi:ATP-dependent Zn protease
MREAYAAVKGRLAELKDVIQQVSDELFEEKELDGARVKEIMAAKMHA